MNYRVELLRYLGLGTFVVVDLETTGIDPEKDDIIEIGAIKYIDGKESDAFEQLVNPGRPIPEFIRRLTGISDDDVADKPKIDAVFDRLDRFIDKAPFVGHQVNFDASFLEFHYRKTHNDFHNWDNHLLRFKYLENTRLDTLFLARIFMPFMASFKLTDMAKAIGHDLENAHRAVEDARATAQLFMVLVDRALAVDNSVLINAINLLYPNSVRAKSFFKPVLDFKKANNITITDTTLLDDVTNAQQFYNVIGEQDDKNYAIADRDELQLVDSAEIEAYFTETGRLANLIKTYELRDPQQNMAVSVAEGFNESQFVVAEAGTGTGKSMAYLIPAIEWAVKNRHAGQRVIVSTNTKNLQEQLFFKDIPMLYSASGGKFTAAILKGRANYLCLDKWHTMMTDMNQRISQQERSRIIPLVLWVQQTRTGDIAENSGFQIERNIGLWSKLIAEQSYCPGRSCKYYDDCFLMKARENARKADLVIINHSLLFSDLVSGHAVIGEFDNLIIDEAHNIEKTASDYLGTGVNFWSFRNIYHRLYEEEPKRTGLLQQLDYRLNRGAVSEDERNHLYQLSNTLKQASKNLKEKVLIFFNEFSRTLRAKYISNAAQGQEESRVRYHQNFRFFKSLYMEIDAIEENLGACINTLTKLNKRLSHIRAKSFEFQDQLSRELLALQELLLGLKKDFAFCIASNQEQFVYWLDIPRDPLSNNIGLNAVPLNIGEVLKKHLWDKLKTGVFSSATLAVNNNFDYFLSRTGLDLIDPDRIDTQILGSNFDYEKQMFLGISDYLPDPRNDQFAAAVANSIKELHARHKTGMLVLFTNYSMLNWVYETLKPHFTAERILLLAQGKSGSRTNIINQFRENNDSVLLGTDSFWEGVDVPGKALEVLFIPKLPFGVPTEPLVAARMEDIKKRGGNPFFEYSVPEAILKFRQGIGRLIRSKSDIGAVIVADNRLSRMQYGQQFVNSLPVAGDVYFDEKSMLDALVDWFNEKNEN